MYVSKIKFMITTWLRLSHLQKTLLTEYGARWSSNWARLSEI